MLSPEENHEQQSTYELNLKSLQADLAKSKKIYKHQENRLNQFTIKADKLKPLYQNDPKEPSLTFKKFKPKQINQAFTSQYDNPGQHQNH